MPPGIGYTDPMQQMSATAQAGDEKATDEQMKAFAASLPPDRWEAMKGYVQSLPEDQREAWFRDFATNHGATRIDAQDAMTRADALRVAQPGMGGEPGGFQVAASPLAHIGAGMQNYQANKLFKQGEADLAEANRGMTQQQVQGAKGAIGPLGPPPMGPAGGQPVMGPQGRGAAPGGPPAPAGPMGPAGRGAGPGGPGGGSQMAEMIRQMAMRGR